MMDYTTLVSAIQDYTENTETSFVAMIPTFVRQAEERILRTVRIAEMRKEATGSLTATSAALTAPADYLAPYSLGITVTGTGIVYLIHKDASFIREAYPDSASYGVPVFYADHLPTKFLIGPTPDLGYAYTLTYYYDPESIVDAGGGTSWLGNNASSVLLNAALKEAYIYMKGEADVLDMYERQYREALEGLMRLGLVRELRDDYRDGREAQ